MALPDNYKAEAQAVYEIARRTAEPRLLEIGETDGEKVSVLLLPNEQGGVKALSVRDFLAEYRDAPERKAGTARLFELASFVAWVNRFKDADSVLFASPDSANPMLSAVIDYHRKTGHPRFGEHRAVYAFPLS